MKLRIPGSGRRISTRFYAAIGFTCLITLITIVVAWFSFERISVSQQMIFETTLPESEVVVGIARTSGAIVAVVPRLTSAISQEELDAVSAAVASLRQEFDEQLTSMLVSDSQGFASVSEKGRSLLETVGNIEDSMHQLFSIRERGRRFRNRLGRPGTGDSP